MRSAGQTSHLLALHLKGFALPNLHVSHILLQAPVSQSQRLIKKIRRIRRRIE